MCSAAGTEGQQLVTPLAPEVWSCPWECGWKPCVLTSQLQASVSCTVALMKTRAWLQGLKPYKVQLKGKPTEKVGSS